ncbi:hypothetical protein BJ912DRAFT_1068402 [Pholiota molesta]|nr:hypothetical protein BJ912DRAFT_1068402 [Pholiota molesta]
MARPKSNPSRGKPAQQPSDDVHTSKTATKNVPNAKRTLDTVSDAPAGESEQAPHPKKPRTRKVVEETLAAPASPVQHPARPAAARRSTRTTTNTKAPAVGQKRKRCTKAEMAADKVAAETEKTRLEELAIENQKKITQMDLDEDINKMEMEAKTIRKFSDLNQLTESSEEEFVGLNDVLDSSSVTSSSEDAPEDDFLALKRSNQALQKELNALKAQGGSGGKKNVGGKKSKRVTFAAASGLRSDWNSQSRAVKVAPKKRSHVEILSGGLEDSDIDDTNTFAKDAAHSRKTVTEEELAKASKNAIRDPSRKNELVAIVSNKSDSEDDFSPPATRSLPPKPSAKKVTIKKTRVATVKIKSEQKESLPGPNEEVVHRPTRRFTASSIRTDDLPDFMKPLWRKAFLPTLYDKFFASNEPFLQFFKGSNAFIALLQDIVDEVFPTTSYKVNMTDAVYQLAYKRVNERRSIIGSSAVEVVKQHVNSLGGEKEAREWTRWAMRSDGPLFFKTPSPFNSPTDRNDPAYTHPEGRLLSQFILNLAAPSLRLKQGSISENGYPRGLFALIMAALERAVQSLLKPLDGIKEFSNEYWGSKVNVYHSSLRTIEEARWKEIFDECGLGVAGENAEDENNQADLSLLDNTRAFLFDFASPAKHRT